MSTTTAIILVGQAHPNHSGINPSHLIQLTENSRPALILQDLINPGEPTIIIPTVETMAEDVYLMIAVFILKKLQPDALLKDRRGKSMYDLMPEAERLALYKRAIEVIDKYQIKVVFSILEYSTLMGQLQKLKSMPHDIEITVPFFKKESSSWDGELSVKDFQMPDPMNEQF